MLTKFSLNKQAQAWFMDIERSLSLPPFECHGGQHDLRAGFCSSPRELHQLTAPEGLKSAANLHVNLADLLSKSGGNLFFLYFHFFYVL